MKLLESEIIDFFNKHEGIVALILFGSFAKGTSRSESDVDIAVLFDKKSIPTKMEIIELREALADVLKKEVDLVCLNNASPIIGSQVYKYGKVIALFDSKAYNDYLVRLFNEYVELKIMRKPIEDGILKRRLNG